MLPKKITLHAIGKNEGFVPVGFLSGKDHPHPEREMKRAPDKGYVQDLVLDASVIQRQVERGGGDNKDPYRFYFKINGKYGRGQLWFIPKQSGDDDLNRLRDQISRLKALGTGFKGSIQPGITDFSPDAVCFYARFDVQPDGSTNLETGE